MDFDAFIDQAWTDHATDPAGVAARLPQALAAVAGARPAHIWLIGGT